MNYKNTQQQVIIKYLQEHSEGLNSYIATYSVLYPEIYPKKIKQAPTRIKELKVKGYSIAPVRNKDRSVNWILVSSLAKPLVSPTPTQTNLQGAYIPSWQEETVKVWSEKLQTWTWEKKSDLEQRQLI